MLKFRKLAYRPWPVTVTLQECDESTGEVVEAKSTFVAHFKPFTEEDLKAAHEAAKKAHPAPKSDGEENPDAKEADEQKLPLHIVLRRNASIFASVMCGWGPEVLSEDGAPIPYSAEALAALVTGPDGLAISAGINAALFQIRFGVAPQKNSETSPSPGPSTAGTGEVATS